MRSSFKLGLLILAILTLKLGEFGMLIKLNELFRGKTG